MDFFPTVLIAFPKTDLDFTDCCMNLFSTMTMFMFLCKYDRPSIILFVVFPSPLKRRSTQSSSCLIFAKIAASVSSLSTCQMVPAPSPSLVENVDLIKGIFEHFTLDIKTHNKYESFSDVGESRVWFASKNLIPCRMHWNAFLLAQIIAKCHSFPNLTCYRRKSTIWPGKLISSKKNT